MNQTTRTYEGMFLVEAGNPDFQAASEPVRTILQRAQAEILAIHPWDERRLAYEIRGRKRSLYILTYFKLDSARVTEIEHECELDERILRSMILRRDRLTDQELNAPTPVMSGSRRGSEDHPEGAAEETGAEVAGNDETEEAAGDK